MKDIDFLPSEMLRQRAARSQRKWQVLVTSIFVVMLIGAFLYQTVSRRRLSAELARLTPLYDAARQQQRELDQLRLTSVHMHDAAALYAMLDYRWPRTQLLAAIVNPLGRQITLTSVRIATMTETRSARSATATTLTNVNDGGQSSAAPARQDLERLLAAAQARPDAVEIVGTTRDPAELHQLLEQLTRAPYFVSARLVSLASAEQSAEGGRTADATDESRDASETLRFTIRAELRRESDALPAQQSAATHVAWRTNEAAP